jgi:hypothetical protein
MVRPIVRFRNPLFPSPPPRPSLTGGGLTMITKGLLRFFV